MENKNLEICGRRTRVVACSLAERNEVKMLRQRARQERLSDNEKSCEKEGTRRALLRMSRNVYCEIWILAYISL